MTLNPQFFIQCAGVLQLFVAAANFSLPKKLKYQQNLTEVSPIVRQIFYVHSLYIVLVLIGFGVICLCFPEELSGASALGKFFCRFLAIFWGLRVFLQFTYYDRATKAAHPKGALLFGAVFLTLAFIFVTTAILGK